jgi:CHAT domain-containing protein/tetratricopeptide (TPR) repeat protein
LTRSFDQHLEEDEIQTLASSGWYPAESDESLSERRLGEAEFHAERCQECQRKVRMHRDMQSVLKGLKFLRRADSPSGCPKNIDWNAVVAGVLTDSDTASLLKHAATCNHCGGLLQTATQFLHGNTTPEEEALLSAMDFNPHERKAMAQRMQRASDISHQPRRDRWSFRLVGILGLGAAALAVLLISIWITVRARRSYSTDELIARAYSQNRTIKLRFRGAGYAPLRQQRGSNTKKPLSLLEAEVATAKKLDKDPRDPNSLDAEGREYLLDGSYDSSLKYDLAVETLQRAIEADPSSTNLKTDLALAFSLRGQPGDLERADELFDQLLRVNPKDTVALFNSATIKEQLQLYCGAKKGWETFLQIEKDPGWAAEGKRNYEAILKQAPACEGSTLSPNRDPGAALAFLEARSKGTTPQDWPSSLDESYLEIASTQWLRLISSDKDDDVGALPREDTPAWHSLQALALVLHQKHGDKWLPNLLAGPYSKFWSRGLRELSDAARADSVGDMPAVVQHAARSLADFRVDGNVAGQTAASFEYAVGLTRSQFGNRCLPVSLSGLQQLHHSHYPWMEASLLLELSTCYGIRGNPRKAQDCARRAAVIADKAGYEGLRVEALNYLDGVTTPWVASSESWDRIHAGLSEFWKCKCPPLYGGDFYVDMIIAAEAGDMWHVAEDAGNESVLLYAQTDDRVAEAVARHYLAQAAEGAEDSELAETEYQRASWLLSRSLKGDPAARITLEIERASLEVRENKTQAAEARLADVEKDLSKLQKDLSGSDKKGLSELQNQYASLSYHETLGELDLHSGNAPAAQKNLQQAITLIESSETLLSSDDDRLLWHRYNSNAYRTLLEIYCRVYRDKDKSFAFQEWYRGAPLRASERGQHASHLKPINRSNFLLNSVAEYSPEQLRVERGTAVLSWISFPTGLAIWLMDARGPELEWLDVPSDEFKATLNQFAKLCADPSSDQVLISRDARRLYSWLIQPFRSRLRDTTRLIIESDYAAGPLPYQALQASDGQYLGDRFQILESPGIAYSRVLRPNGSLSAESVVLAIGNPRVDQKDGPAFPSLPDAETEAETIATMFNNHYLLTGSEAKLSEIVRLLPKAELLHFAGHALLTGSEPALLLAGSGVAENAVLGTNQLLSMDLRKLKLVILSGCDTGVSEQGLADSRSLIRVFLNGGVPNVVASKWSVNSQVTSELMAKFYSNLTRGKSASEALAIAERAIRSRPETLHPYYWAAFACFGGEPEGSGKRPLMSRNYASTVQ